MVLVKICGLTNLGDATAAVAAGADLLGFVFVPGTPRALDPARAGWIRGLDGAEKVGVFRDAPLGEIERVRDGLGLDRVQLHGNEPDWVLERLGPDTLRRVRPTAGPPWPRVAELQELCLPLLDPGAGSGRAWGWRELPPPPGGLRFGLAGGLDPATVAEACRQLRPALVDVSSGVEAAPGVKDRRLVEEFVARVRIASLTDGP